MGFLALKILLLLEVMATEVSFDMMV
jgi:hypothetical protein